MRARRTIRDLLSLRVTTFYRTPLTQFSPRAMSSTAPQDGGAPANSSSQTPASEPDSNSTAEKKVLPLPAPPKDDDTVTLNVDGQGVKLDRLGPLVVNQDGTMSRISNWTEMSEIERQNTLRILGKRNQLRLEKLREGSEDQ